MAKYPISFGRHLLLERINVGGMAEVFKAKSFGVEGFERIVAVKRILPTLADDDEFTTMFVDEARIASQLTHQNIVQIYDLGKHEGTFYISMEYVAGRDMRAILDGQKRLGRPMEVGKACFIVSRVCEALEYAHRKRDPAGRDLRIIHRDVTPQNVILSYEGEVKLCDFGIAKAASRVSRTQVGVLKGKFAYMSPEQVRGQPIDRRSDLFALGVIFYEMLTGERLFLGESDYATLEGVRNAVIAPPRQYNPAITPELEAIMLRMLTREPRDRFQWASEVHEALLDHLLDQGRPYHSRHLRKWMQETYAREIEVENAKLESFMELRLPPAPTPPPDEVLSAMARLDEGASAPDPAEQASEAFDEGTQDPTDHYPAPDRAMIEEAHAARTRPETDSPVSDMYGAPDVAEAAAADPAEPEEIDPAMVRPAQPDLYAGLPEERPDSEGERTQFTAPPLPPGQADPTLLGDNETLYDDGNETVMGDEALDHEISAAQAELLSRLGGDAIDDGQTVDGADEGFEDDPDGATLHGDDTENGPLAFDVYAAAADDTNIQPLVASGDTDEDFVAPTALRAEAIDESALFADDGGTVEEAPVPTFDPAVMRGVTPTQAREGSNPTWSDETPREPTPPPMPPPNGARPISGAARRAPPSGIRPNFTPRPIIERHRPSSEGPPPAPPATAPAPPAGAGRSRRLVLALVGGVALLGAVTTGVVMSLMSPDRASLVIVSTPQEVKITVDDSMVGSSTPVEIPGLEVGPHRVVLEAPGYRPYEQTVQIRAARPHKMRVALERRAPAPAPEAEEGDELPLGDGVDPEDAPPPPPPEAPPAVRAQARQGSLLIATVPIGAAVWIDGRDTGLRTPVREPYRLASGRHVVTLIANGRRYEYDVKIRAGQRTTLEKALR